MFYKLRKLIAEKIHPEKDNFEYWLLKSLSKKELMIDVPSLVKKHGKKNVKSLAASVIDNPVFQYIVNIMEQDEIEYMVKTITHEKQFQYSRAIIHVLTTIKEKLNLLISLPLDEKESFDKFRVT